MTTEGRAWDAGSYHNVSGPLAAMGGAVLDRLALVGGETVLDAGCGTGRVTAALLERLPTGRVIAVDADPDMVGVARVNLAPFGERARVEQLDLLHLDVHDELDAVFSTATFHWILDHEKLFATLFAALRPGGVLVAQCGGRGNIAACLGAADEVARSPQWAHRFEGWRRPASYATAEDTEQRLRDAGFGDVRCWLEPQPVVPDDPREYLATINLGAHLQRLESDTDREAFMDAVMDRLPTPVTIDYVRLNIDACKPS